MNIRDFGGNGDDVSQIELKRRGFRRRQTGKSLLISCVSLLVFAAAIYVIFSHSEGWARVQAAYFSPERFVEAIPKVGKGLLLNIKILCVSVVCVGITATLLAVARTTRSAVLFPLRLLATVYTNVFRGIPMIICLYLVGFGIPALGIFGRIPAEVLGCVAVSLIYSAYVAEVIRAGIEAVHPSQRMAARALGFSHARTMRIIILPQAVRKIIPALMNDFVAMQKDVGLVSVLGGVDAVRSAQILNAVNFNYTPYVVAGVFFILMSFPFILLIDRYAKRLQNREQLQGAV
ncbi:MAG: amino acid ABC transporter permease [Clostridiales Family XIII bacterium]|jgi:polar amino acid transport system permease protein|nr:amino acid ABC transporter permease [Clostridiales Family XIII bacterium]